MQSNTRFVQVVGSWKESSVKISTCQINGVSGPEEIRTHSKPGRRWGDYQDSNLDKERHRLPC